jgi:hypothetical protein
MAAFINAPEAPLGDDKAPPYHQGRMPLLTARKQQVSRLLSKA